MKSKFERGDIKDFSGYEGGGEKKTYLLNANESPSSLLEDEEIRREFLELIGSFKPNLYPDPENKKLREKLSSYTGLSPSYISVGNGGDEIINNVARAFLDKGDKVLLHKPSFSVYEDQALIQGADIINIEDRENRIDTEGLKKILKEERPKLAIICRPNNPTGYMIGEEEMLELLDFEDSLFLLDEAYIEFSDSPSLKDQVLKKDNLIILRTLSKAFGLAGLRVGYALACPDLIGSLEKVRMPYNISSFSQSLASLALDRLDFKDKNVSYIKGERNRVYGEILEMGIEVLPSSSNFLLINTKKKEKLLKALDDRRIAVRSYGDSGPLKNSIRFSLGKREVNDLVLEAMKEII